MSSFVLQLNNLMKKTFICYTEPMNEGLLLVQLFTFQELIELCEWFFQEKLVIWAKNAMIGEKFVYDKFTQFRRIE